MNTDTDIILGENREAMLRQKRCRELAYGGADPIYKVLTIKKDPEDESGFDLRSVEYNGFYHNLEDAIAAVHLNVSDLHGRGRDAGFIMCEFPGISSEDDPSARIFFVWDDIKEGFYEAPEPQFFK